MHYLNLNKVLTESQHGFRPEYSINTAALSLHEKILESIKHGDSPAEIFCNLSRAFDCVSHDVLLHNLYSYRITDIQNK